MFTLCMARVACFSLGNAIVPRKKILAKLLGEILFDLLTRERNAIEKNGCSVCTVHACANLL